MRALITGCSSGFGRCTAIELARRGHEVIATARNPETIANLDVAQKLALDVNCDDSVREAMAQAGELDALVNNAGWSTNGPIEKTPLDEVRQMFETNFFGATRMIQAVLPGMRAQKHGVIVNITSLAGRVAPPLAGFYAASKFALEGLSEALHLEVGHFGIRVAIVEPGYFQSSFRANSAIHGIDEAPYDELYQAWRGTDRVLAGGDFPAPEVAAAEIADAVEGKGERLRWPVGKDAELVTKARSSLDDVSFERAMREMLKITW
jgi:NAD(P)-dependent dehydrogenase (short-subunit alcohol dehydrogenase family)